MKKVLFISITLLALLSGCASSYVYYRAKVHDFLNDNASKNITLVVNKLNYQNDSDKNKLNESLKNELANRLGSCINTSISDETTIKVVSAEDARIRPEEMKEPVSLEMKDYKDIRYLIVVDLSYEIHDINWSNDSAIGGDVAMVASYKGRSTAVDIRSRVHDLLKKKLILELDINSWGEGKSGAGVMLTPVIPIPFPYLARETAFGDACDLLGELVRQAIAGELLDKN